MTISTTYCTSSSSTSSYYPTTYITADHNWINRVDIDPVTIKKEKEAVELYFNPNDLNI